MSNLVPFAEYQLENVQTSWLLENILTSGGTSLLAGDPKCGKSQFVRQLIKAILNESDFLNQSLTKSEKVIYLALEESPVELKKRLLSLGIDKDTPNLLIGDRRWSNGKNLDELKQDIETHKPSLCIIDTFVAFSQLNDMNAKVYKSIHELGQIAEHNNCHIMIVHHKNKSEAGGTKAIMGSVAFFGAVDTALILSGEGNNKVLDIDPRYASKKKIKFDMSPDEITNIICDAVDVSCEDALLLKIQQSVNGYDFRDFKGFSKQTIQASKQNLLKNEIIREEAGVSGQPVKLYLVNNLSL
jgi:predicted ATP-dependent serine protease